MRNVMCLILVFILVFSCTVNPVSQEGDYKGGISSTDGSSVELINKIWQETAGGYRVYKTNDRVNQSNSGRTFFYSLGSETVMTAFEAEIVKVSGYGAGGAGLFFCASGSEASGDLSGYFVSIDTQGYYTIRAMNKNKVETVTPWSPTAQLVQGYGQVNRLKVEYLGANRFKLSINGVEVTTFPAEPAQFVQLTGGRYGYSVGVSAYEQFPAVPLEVKFR